VSLLKGILVSPLRRASAPFSSGAALCAALLLALTFACRDACASVSADAHASRETDVRRAEKVLPKLRLLYDAAEADDADAYHSLASKLYPGLFITIAEMHPSDLSTDLSTAVFLAEELGRKWFDAGAATAVCRDERPDIYMPLCTALRGGTVRQLLLAKSRLHARWAEAVLRENRGEADADTTRALAEMDAARANDLLIAARVVETLRALEALPRPSKAAAGRVERFDASAVGSNNSNNPDAEFTEALRDAGLLLTWMPRSTTFYQLSNARLAYADGLWWQSKARQSKSLVIAADSFQPDPLKEMRLDALQVSAAAEANWKAAAKHTRLAEQSLSRPDQQGVERARPVASNRDRVDITETEGREN
jgi:hypothetical protein